VRWKNSFCFLSQMLNQDEHMKIKYRLVEFNKVNVNDANPFWNIQVWDEDKQEWNSYGNISNSIQYTDYQTALRNYRILTGRTADMTVIKEDSVKIEP